MAIEEMMDKELEVVDEMEEVATSEEIRRNFEKACAEIAQDCEREGLPSTGWTYADRVDALKRRPPYNRLFEEG